MVWAFGLQVPEGKRSATAQSFGIACQVNVASVALRSSTRSPDNHLPRILRGTVPKDVGMLADAVAIGALLVMGGLDVVVVTTTGDDDGAFVTRGVGDLGGW
jgi:hypothetical protein